MILLFQWLFWCYQHQMQHQLTLVLRVFMLLYVTIEWNHSKCYFNELSYIIDKNKNKRMKLNFSSKLKLSLGFNFYYEGDVE